MAFCAVCYLRFGQPPERDQQFPPCPALLKCFRNGPLPPCSMPCTSHHSLATAARARRGAAATAWAAPAWPPSRRPRVRPALPRYPRSCQRASAAAASPATAPAHCQTSAAAASATVVSLSLVAPLQRRRNGRVKSGALRKKRRASAVVQGGHACRVRSSKGVLCQATFAGLVWRRCRNGSVRWPVTHPPCITCTQVLHRTTADQVASAARACPIQGSPSAHVG